MWSRTGDVRKIKELTNLHYIWCVVVIYMCISWAAVVRTYTYPYAQWCGARMRGTMLRVQTAGEDCCHLSHVKVEMAACIIGECPWLMECM